MFLGGDAVPAKSWGMYLRIDPLVIASLESSGLQTRELEASNADFNIDEARATSSAGWGFGAAVGSRWSWEAPGGSVSARTGLFLQNTVMSPIWDDVNNDQLSGYGHYTEMGIDAAFEWLLHYKGFFVTPQLALSTPFVRSTSEIVVPRSGYVNLDGGWGFDFWNGDFLGLSIEPGITLGWLRGAGTTFRTIGVHFGWQRGLPGTGVLKEIDVANPSGSGGKDPVGIESRLKFGLEFGWDL